jgi:hypothetical protein
VQAATRRHVPFAFDRMSDKKPSLAQAVAPEDLRGGDHVAVLNEIHEFVVCFDPYRGVERVPVRLMPFDNPEPLKVIDVCLPFVSVRRPSGAVRVVDVRRSELARLDAGFARRLSRKLAARRKSHPFLEFE